MNRDERPQRKERERLRSEEAGVRVQPGEAVRRVAIEKERREEARRNRSTRGEYDSVLPETFPLYAMDLEGEGTFEGCTGTGAGFEYIADTQVEADPVARLFGRCQSFEGGGEVHTMSGKGVTLDKKGREVLRGVGERSRKESGEAMRVAMDLQAEIGFTHAFATDGSKHRDGRTAYGIWTGARLREQGAHKEEGLRMLQTEPGMEERATGRGMEGGRLPATWEIVDAEMYAVFRALLRVYLETRSEEGDGALGEKRILIMSDCQSAIKEIEKGWREGEVRHELARDKRRPSSTAQGNL